LETLSINSFFPSFFAFDGCLAKGYNHEGFAELVWKIRPGIAVTGLPQ
jgi:hypothetical protein